VEVWFGLIERIGENHLLFGWALFLMYDEPRSLWPKTGRVLWAGLWRLSIFC